MRAMSKSKKGGRADDRHQPHKMVRVPLDVYEAVAELAREDDRSATATIKRLLIEALRQKGRWPAAGTPPK